MTAKAAIDVKILVMDRHFLYLPLYVAQFDHPKSRKLPFFGMIPPKYSVEVTRPQRETDRSDKAVFDQLMDARLSSSNIMFAACDPTVLLARPEKNALMAASLITSSAFWAVNHDVRNVRLVSDLSSFDRILCYREGTTSNLIARRIAKRDTNKLTVVDSTDEIQRLEGLGEGTLAISPEVLKIANLIHGPLRPGEKRAEIVLELSTSKEFSNVLTTALFTRAEVVEKHPELVSGVLSALQTALVAINAGHPMVKESARHNFVDAFYLDEALEIARRGNVFPETIQIRHDRWQRACEFYFISQALADGREKSALTKREQLTAEELYGQAVRDRGLQSLVVEAITRGFRGALDGQNATSADGPGRWPRQAILWALGLLMVGFVAGHSFSDAAPGAGITIGLSWAMMLFAGWWSGELARYRKSSGLYPAHLFSFALLWWALHELVIPSRWDAHFLSGVVLDGAVAGGILTLTGTWVVGVGLFVRSQWSNNAKKLPSTGDGR